MKKIGKIFAAFVVIAIMATMLVMPVTAESVNYLESRNWNFEADSLNTNTKISNASYEIVTPESNKGTAGDRVLLVTPSGTSNAMVKDEWVTGGRTDIVPGKTYRFSYDIRTVASGTTTSARVKLESASPSSNTMTIDGDGSNNYYTGAYVSNIGNEWTTVSGEFKLENTSVGATEYKGFHAIADIGNGSTAAVYLDNFIIEEVPPLAVESVLDGGAALAPLSGAKIKYTFNRSITATVDASKFTITPSAEIESVTGSGKEYTLTLDALTPGTEYTVTLSGITDKNESVTDEITIKTIPVATSLAAPEILAAGGKDGSFDSMSTGASVNGKVNVQTDANIAYSGSNYIAIDGTSSSSSVYKQLFIYVNSGYSIGDELVVSFRARAASGTIRVTPVYEITAASSNTMTPAWANSTSNNGTYVTVGTEWTKVAQRLTINPSGVTGSKQGFHLGIRVLDAGTAYIDDIEIRKLVPADIDSNVGAVVTTTKAGVELDIISADNTTKTVYVLAAKYDGQGKMDDIKLIKQDIGKENVTVALNGDFANYSFFVWNTDLTPVCTDFMYEQIY